MSRVEDLTPAAADELLHRIALLSVYGLGATRASRLIRQYGSAVAVFQASPDDLTTIPRCGEELAGAVRDPQERLDRARREVDFMQAHHIHPLLIEDSDYPQRLKQCPDAPPILYTLGNAVLNAPHVVSVVGTRRCTQYGRDAVNALVSELQTLVPDVLIVSGLAHGIDGVAHRAALTYGTQTLGVLAHGLDHIYPAAHRQLACDMLQQGGLLTEYDTQAHTDKGNFLSRNRIIAGLSDVTIVAESSTRGGSLVTARIASTYGRRVCAFPGRIRDEYSSGCNMLIREGVARLLTSASDLVAMMHWGSPLPSALPRQQELEFDNVSPDERLVMDYLQQHTSADTTELSDALSLDFPLIFEILLNLETRDLVRSTRANRYELR